ncbi:hypothetical protein KY289_027198 [Solanum tuberosum]|nr:hypothetical protein KY289_027198 [Solanum tuberosum]
MAFDFCIEYKKGVKNKVDDALSRKPDAELLAMSLLSPHNSLLDQIKTSWSSDQSLQGIIAKVKALPYKYFIWHNNQLRWKGRLVVGADSELKRLQSLFYWKTLVQDTRNFINKCDIYQRHKYDVAASPGLIQPLSMPDGVWTGIFLDFIEGLPKSNGKWLQPYRQVSLAVRTFPKLVAKYYGPYPVDAKIGAVAYMLLLLADVLIHPVFHVSQLKRCLEVPSIINHPLVFHLSSPEAVLDKRLVKKGNRAVGQVLVNWSGIDDTQTTWEFESELLHRFPTFHP